ncbi:terminase TerL endonuclease subunit [Mycolicibacterium moriokaense]|uniref:terminase TerL endonuclease subunit n=1 Tax=Mycolicibacterium moriokaense TaxID=39691 RepID=UPI001056718D|nr:terminase TerL endonuclease subunit [Mycolicibacterium moriokaense]MCV7039693.1 hypothetical protein [Mycolicibacterium moriokaense]
MAEFQKQWIRDTLAPGVRQSVMIAPRGTGKSTLLAAFACWATFDRHPTGQPLVYIMATTVQQACDSVYDVLVKMIAAEPELSRRSIVKTAVSSAKVVVGYNDAECRPVANDFGALQGKDPTLFVVDELAEQPFSSWAAAVMASGKRAVSCVVGISTPGFEQSEKSALWYLRERYLDGDTPRGFVLTEFSAPEGADHHNEQVWIDANPAIREGYLDIEAVRDDYKMMPESYFRTYRLAQFVEGTECWLGVDGRKVWRALKSDYRMLDGADTWVGVDVGLKRDCSAVVIGQRTPDGTLHTTAKIWKPSPDQAIDVTAIMAHLRGLHRTYNVVAVAYDPAYFDVQATDLADEGLPMVQLPQTPERMVPACGALYEAIMRGELSHDGATDYERHILNAMPVFTDKGFRLTKSKSRGHIDAAIALALCHDRAQHARALPKLVCL